ELSSKVIDECATVEPTNRVTNKLSELADDIAIVESFSHMVAFITEEGLVLIDASGKQSRVAVVD
ncbi:MAG: MBL fold metallo-hydrolase, partial [Actinomycetota bacterium]|nr:MBL fold metallo-hydrolase [Actinomycetota bacterium]